MDMMMVEEMEGIGKFGKFETEQSIVTDEKGERNGMENKNGRSLTRPQYSWKLERKEKQNGEKVGIESTIRQSYIMREMREGMRDEWVEARGPLRHET